MALTGVPLIALTVLATAAAIAVTTLFWGRFGRWRPVTRSAGLHSMVKVARRHMSARSCAACTRASSSRVSAFVAASSSMQAPSFCKPWVLPGGTGGVGASMSSLVSAPGRSGHSREAESMDDRENGAVMVLSPMSLVLLDPKKACCPGAGQGHHPFSSPVNS